MKRVLALAATAILASPATAVEFVVNGGFEAPVTANGGFAQFFGGNTFPGWTVLGNDVIVINSSYSEGGLAFNANAGLNSIDLTGAGNTGPSDGIVQTLATGPGKYKLSFYVGNASPTGGNAASYGLPSTVNLSINGGPIQSFTNGVDTPFAINWKQFSVTFTTLAPTTIAFTNGTPFGDNMLGLDDVSVTGVPEAATWAMLIIGFGLVGVSARRRKVVVAA